MFMVLAPHSVQHRDFGEFLRSAAWPYITVAKSIERIDDKTYRCEAEPVRFGKSDIVVFLDVKVDVDASKPRALIQVASGKVRDQWLRYYPVQFQRRPSRSRQAQRESEGLATKSEERGSSTLCRVSKSCNTVRL